MTDGVTRKKCRREIVRDACPSPRRRRCTRVARRLYFNFFCFLLVSQTPRRRRNRYLFMYLFIYRVHARRCTDLACPTELCHAGRLPRTRVPSRPRATTEAAVAPTKKRARKAAGGSRARFARDANRAGVSSSGRFSDRCTASSALRRPCPSVPARSSSASVFTIRIMSLQFSELFYFFHGGPILTCTSRRRGPKRSVDTGP